MPVRQLAGSWSRRRTLPWRCKGLCSPRLASSWGRRPRRWRSSGLAPAWTTSATLLPPVPVSSAATTHSHCSDRPHRLSSGEAATAQLFPGAYYREIVEADVAQLAAALTDTGRQHERRSAARLDVLAALARPGAGAAELEGLAQAAGEHGLVAEAAAARHVAELSRAHSACREAERTALDAAAAAKRGLADAQSAMKHERVERGEAQRTARALEDERNALRVQLTRDTEERRRVEGASIKTLEQLKLNDEARWAAERALQAEQRKLQELEAEHSRSATAVAERLAAADRRAGEAAASAATEGARHVEAERRVVALGSRVEALEGVQQQLEAQLNVERDAAANELSLRQASERELAEARDSLRVAKRAAEVAEAERSTAAAEVARLTADLKGAEERLQVANEHSLQGHLEAASSDEALSQLKQLREQDGERLMKLNSAKAELAQALKAAEERVASEVEAAGRAAKEAAARQYELQARLTEASRRVESLQVEHARSELRLEHERAAGSTTQEESSRRTRELAKERRERQQLAHELAAERALRSRCEEEAIALRREVEAARRETEVGAQRLTHLQAELQLATTEASEAAAVREYVDSAHRHREAVARERVSTAPPMPLPAPQLGRPAAGKVHFADEVRDEGMQWLNTTREDGLDDELGRSDLWNFSSGVMARGGATSNRGGLRQRVTTSPSLPQIVGPFRTACT